MARSKYAEVVKHLPALPVDKGEWALEVERKKQDFQKLPTIEVIERLAELKNKQAKLKAAIKEFTAEIEALNQLGVERYDTEGLEEVRLESGPLATLKPDVYASLEDREVFRLWCVEQGLERSMMLAPASVQSMVKERLVDGKACPPGVKAFAKFSLNVTGFKK